MRMQNKTTAAPGCWLERSLLALKRSMLMGMAQVTDRTKGGSSTVERRDTRTVRSKRVGKDKQRGKKTVMQGAGRVRMLHTGLDRDIRVMESGDQLEIF